MCVTTLRRGEKPTDVSSIEPSSHDGNPGEIPMNLQAGGGGDTETTYRRLYNLRTSVEDSTLFLDVCNMLSFIFFLSCTAGDKEQRFAI